MQEQSATQFLLPAARNDGHGGWTSRQLRQQAKREAPARAIQLRMLMKPANDRREAQYAQNRNRCQNALRVAELCGKFAGTFSCDDKGFRLEPVTETSSPTPAMINNVSVFKVEQCALQASKGRS